MIRRSYLSIGPPDDAVLLEQLAKLLEGQLLTVLCARETLQSASLVSEGRTEYRASSRETVKIAFNMGRIQVQGQ
jgi:hypothetical protein